MIYINRLIQNNSMVPRCKNIRPLIKYHLIHCNIKKISLVGEKMDIKEQQIQINKLIFNEAIKRESEWRKNPEFAHDVKLLIQMLNEINNLGYEFRYLKDITWRTNHSNEIIDIVMRYFGKFEDEGISAELVNVLKGIKGRGYTEILIDYIFHKKIDIGFYVGFDNAFLRLRDKRYVSNYLALLNEPEMASKLPLTMIMLGKWHIMEAKELFIKHLDESNPTQLLYSCIKSLAYFSDEDSLAAIIKASKFKDIKISKYAKDTIEKIMNKNRIKND